jgi:hypothetical protein
MTLGTDPGGRALTDEGLARDKDHWFLTCGPWTSPSSQVIHGFIPKGAAGFFPDLRKFAYLYNKSFSFCQGGSSVISFWGK